jgi:S1-C subfamily serine protease
MATVRVTVPVDGNSGFVGGSGAVISSQGHILTNFHVIGTTETGKLYNSKGQIFIAVNTTSLDRAPEVLYMAELVRGDPAMDLALLKIVSRQNGAALPGGFSLPWMTVGDSDALQIGDDLTIVGFPGLGDESVTLTRGTVSGFLAEGGVTRAWIKTDTEISEGNSGGPAVNARGELVGIPSRIRVRTDSGKIGYVRPVNLARSFLALIAP